MIDPGESRRAHGWDPVGFLLLLFLLIVLGGAVLFVIRWIAMLIEDLT